MLFDHSWEPDVRQRRGPRRRQGDRRGSAGTHDNRGLYSSLRLDRARHRSRGGTAARSTAPTCGSRSPTASPMPASAARSPLCCSSMSPPWRSCSAPNSTLNSSTRTTTSTSETARPRRENHTMAALQRRDGRVSCRASARHPRFLTPRMSVASLSQNQSSARLGFVSVVTGVGRLLGAT